MSVVAHGLAWWKAHDPDDSCVEKGREQVGRSDVLDDAAADDSVEVDAGELQGSPGRSRPQPGALVRAASGDPGRDPIVTADLIVRW